MCHPIAGVPEPMQQIAVFNLIFRLNSIVCYFTAKNTKITKKMQINLHSLFVFFVPIVVIPLVTILLIWLMPFESRD